MLAPDDPWASYARTVVVIVRPGATNLVVEAAEVGVAGPDRRQWPWNSPAPVHVLTAWDAGESRLAEGENRAGQEKLEAELTRLVPSEMWTAVGVDPVSAHREEGVAVIGLPVDAVLGLAARFGQDAIFEWTPQEWAIVSCRSDRRVSFGWSVTPE